MMRRYVSLVLAMGILLLALLPMGAAGAEGVYVTSVELDVYAMALKPNGDGRQLKVTVLPENATDARVYWMSSSEWVATVDSNGYVTPHAAGTTEIRAETSDGEAAVCQVTVTDNLVTGIELSHTEIEMENRTARVLEAEVFPATADSTGITWSSSDRKVAVVNKNGKVFAKGEGSCWISATANGGLDVVARCALTVTHTDRPEKFIALTYDDGPIANTLDILDILDEYDVHVTFFCLGKLVAAHPEYTRKQAARGHEIANHSYNHNTLTKMSLDEAKKEIDDTDAAIMAAIGRPSALVRAPGGAINEKVAQYIGKPFIDWTVDTHDWKYRDPEYVWTFVANNAANLDIVLMHDIRPTTMEATRKIVPYLLEQGFTLITVSELLEKVGGVDETLIYNP